MLAQQSLKIVANQGLRQTAGASKLEYMQIELSLIRIASIEGCQMVEVKRSGNSILPHFSSYFGPVELGGSPFFKRRCRQIFPHLLICALVEPRSVYAHAAKQTRSANPTMAPLARDTGVAILLPTRMRFFPVVFLLAAIDMSLERFTFRVPETR